MKKKLNVLIPCAGKGSRFLEAGYDLPKPLIPVLGKPMIEWVIESIGLGLGVNYIFIVSKEHDELYDMRGILGQICNEYVIFNNPIVIKLDKLTDGAARTVLKAKYHIDNDNPLLIANSDQYIKYNNNLFNNLTKKSDGVVFTFKTDNNPKWSYAKVKNDTQITEIVEKQVVSEHPTCGLYFYKKGSDCIRGIEKMIQKNIRVNSEFYLAPSINQLIEEGKDFRIFDVDYMAGLGTPEDVKIFEESH